ncbi:hypothetical protein PFISCL1PPCAC_456, partial [Pristionchus fissidentatus]
LVLLEPSGHIVAHGACVVDEREVGVGLLALGRSRLLEVGVFSLVLILQFLCKSRVRRLGNNALLVQHRNDTERLLDELNAGLEVEAEVDELPLDVLALVLL